MFFKVSSIISLPRRSCEAFASLLGLLGSFLEHLKASGGACYRRALDVLVEMFRFYRKVSKFSFVCCILLRSVSLVFVVFLESLIVLLSFIMAFSKHFCSRCEEIV